MKKFLLTLWCVSTPVLLYAQKAPFKFGKIDDEIVKLKTHALDTSATAVVLLDYGNTSFRYNSTDGFIFEFTRTTRIKILKKDGLDYGDFEVSYYNNGSSDERISALRGYSHNFVNGGVAKSKLEKSSIFKEEVNDNWDQVKISMPDVKIGTVVELTYTLTSPFTWNLQTWKFQGDIPTVYSEYKAKIPDYFDYQLLFSGYHPLSVNEKKSSAGSVTLQNKNRTMVGKVSQTTFSENKLDFKNKNYRWVANNVPAYEPEPYVASPSDYISKVEFELRGTQFPNRPYKEHMGTWSALNKSFQEHSRFGDAVKLSGYANKELEAISSLSTDKEKVEGLVKLVWRQMEWNEQYRLYATSTLRSAWNKKKGSSADINLMIVAGLKKLGFEADPVLISTRGHGMIRDLYATSNQFNSVVACVQLDGKTLLLDGTDRYLPIGVLPKKCLNGKGWKVSRESPGWIMIKTTVKQERVAQGTFEIDPEGSLLGTVELIAKGYAGYSQHKNFKLQGEENFFESFQTENEKWLIEEYEYNEEDSYDKPFKSKYVVEMNENLIVAGERIYLNPTIDEIMDENPFKLEKREYPVDFAYPIRNTYMFKFNIPEGYEVEELPKPVAFAMPNKDGIFTYSISSMDNTLQLYVDFRINKTMFAQTEYDVLKQFYHQVVQKCEEQVILKKTSEP